MPARRKKRRNQRGGGWITALTRLARAAKTAGRLGRKAGKYAYKNKGKLAKWALKEGASSGISMGSNLLLSSALANDDE